MWVDLLPLLSTLPLLVCLDFFGSETMLFGCPPPTGPTPWPSPCGFERIEVLTKDEPRLLVSS